MPSTLLLIIQLDTRSRCSYFSVGKSAVSITALYTIMRSIRYNTHHINLSILLIGIMVIAGPKKQSPNNGARATNTPHK